MRSRWTGLIVLMVTGCASPALVVEKRTEIVLIPPKSKEAHFFYVSEGIGVTAAPKEKIEDRLKEAKEKLDEMKKPRFPFLGFPVDLFAVLSKDEENLPSRHCQISPGRFFVDPTRDRQLCMEWHVTIADREAFARTVNQSVSDWLTNRYFKDKDEEDLLAEMKRDPDAVELARRPTRPLDALDLVGEFDLASLRRIKAAAKKGFRWLRFEDEKLLIVMPVTPEFARRAVADPRSKALMKEMRAVIDPMEASASDDGLTFTFGGKGRILRWTQEDSRPHRAGEEKALIKHAGAKAIEIDGKIANAERLIEQFIAEKSKK